MLAKSHIPHPDETGDLGRSLCGRPAVLLGEPGAATCTRCARLWEARSADLRGIGWPEALRAIAYVLAGPPVESAPDLRESWRAMDCRRGEVVESAEDTHVEPRRMTPRAWSDAGRPSHAMRCACPVCEWEAASLGVVDTWAAEQQVRPHRRHTCDFGSRDAALQFLVRWREDGPGSRSNAGSVIARLTEARRLEANVQTTQRFDREDLPIRRAQQAVDVERLLRRAFRESAERRGLTVEECVAVVLTTVAVERLPATRVAEVAGLSVAATRAMIAHGRRQFTIEAAAEGLIPMPRAETGLVPLVERIVAERGAA